MEETRNTGVDDLTCVGRNTRLVGAPPAVQFGEVWELGDHRLVCGDCTDMAAVDALMDGDAASLMVTDPPYGVAYRGVRVRRERIRNDNLSLTNLRKLLTAAFTVAPLRNGAACYIHAPAGPNVRAFYAAAGEAGLDIRQALVWVKNHFVLGGSDYHSKHEQILYGWKLGARHYFGGGRRQHSVWLFDKPHRSPLHPTMKPVALIERAILNSSLPGEIVYDGFGGSGSTLIACENTSRRCRMVEIEPQYCSVVVARWEEATSKRARLIETPLKSIE